MAEGFRNFLDAWDALVHQGGRGKTSGLVLGQIGPRGAALFHIRDGTVTRLAVYADHDRAFADLGLPAGRGSPDS
jgi:hypothetical protein